MFHAIISTVAFLAAQLGIGFLMYHYGRIKQKAEDKPRRKRVPVKLPPQYDDDRNIWGFAEEFSHADIGMIVFDSTIKDSDNDARSSLQNRMIKTFAEDITHGDNETWGYTCYREFDPENRNAKPKE